jgi:preprotein translocase SecE subunit
VSRAIRRHPPVTREKPGRRPAAVLPTPKAARQAPRQRRGFLAFLRPRWMEDIISELRKVTWPTRQDTVNLTMVVIVVSVAVGLALGGIDLLFNWFIENTLLR